MQQKGFSLIELILAVGIFAVLMAGATYLVIGSYTPFVGGGNTRELDRVARQSMDVLDVIKDRSWSDIATNASASPSAIHINKDAAGVWNLASGGEVIGAFTRSIYVYNVQRDDTGAIVTSGGTDDPSTKKVVVVVSATGRADYKLEAYMTNWESFRMTQTDWGGSSGTSIWTAGITGYSSQSNMDLPTTSGNLSLATSTM